MKCGECNYYHREDKEIVWDALGTLETMGTCRCRCPQALHFDGYHQTVWPFVRPYESGCGEWKPAPRVENLEEKSSVSRLVTCEDGVQREDDWVSEEDW
jgi:hypothetical protein